MQDVLNGLVSQKPKPVLNSPGELKNVSVFSVGEKATIDPFQPNSLQTYRQGTRNIIGDLEMFLNISKLILFLANKMPILSK